MCILSSFIRGDLLLSGEVLDHCHGAGLGATILSSGVDVLAVPRVTVSFRCASRNEGALSRR